MSALEPLLSPPRRPHPRLPWRLEHPGAVALCPDGRRAVTELRRTHGDRTLSQLWLLDTAGGEPRALTPPGLDARQPAWSPRGERLACSVRTVGDTEAPLQPALLDPATGALTPLPALPGGAAHPRWLDGQRLLVVAPLWPDLPDLAAQAERLRLQARRRRQGVRIDDAAGQREARLLLLDLDAGAAGAGGAGGWRDLLAGHAAALDGTATAFDVSPDGQRVAFAGWPRDTADASLPGQPRALGELDLAEGTLRWRVRDTAWDCSAPRWAPPSALDGQRVAFVARDLGTRADAPAQLALWDGETGAWSVLSAAWDHAVRAPLRWEEDGGAVLLRAEQAGRQHLWRFDLADRRAEVQVRGGWLRGFDKAAGMLVTVADALEHPARVHAHPPGAPPLRIERFNDARLAGFAPGLSEEVALTGAQDEAFCVWLHHPPGSDGRQRLPVVLLLPDGPQRAAGERWDAPLHPALLAAQGQCVVVVPNLHGSSGQGQAWAGSIAHRWGGLELQDLEALLAWLAAQPWADPRRVFALGVGYGGFLAAWLNARQAPLAAIACLGAVFDWDAMLASEAWPRYVQALGALPWTRPESLLVTSPQASAGAMRTPTLIAHAVHDARVPLQQALAHHHALQALGVASRLLRVDAPDLQRPRLARRVLAEVLRWFRHHDPGAAGTA